jgi:alpha-L-fucosidase
LDIVSRGGNFLLNVGPTASGEIPEIQKKVLMGLGDWMAINNEGVYGTRQVADIAPSDTPWVRWVKKGERIFAYIDAVGAIEIEVPERVKKLSKTRILGGSAIEVKSTGYKISMTVPAPKVAGPTVIEFSK